MDQLTEEQRKRIEENRRKALELRAAKSKLGNGNVLPTASNSSVPKESFRSPTSTSNFSKGSFQPPTSKHQNPPASSYQNSFTASYNKSNASSYQKPFQGFQNRDTTVINCVLLSRERFLADVRYHKELVEIFKTIPSRLYDTQTKKWNFLLSDHERLISQVKPLQPDVLVVPLPRLIIKTFSHLHTEKNVLKNDLTRIDPVMQSALLPFQKEGVNFAINHKGRVLIADDMGLGKTIQAIAITDYYREDWPLLVVTPSSVRYSWEESFHTWLPSLERHEISIISSGKDHIPNNKVILMSYDLLTKMKDAIRLRKFKSVIFDESHFLKNPKSARTKAAQDVIKNMNRIIMLSGTPALSRPIELYVQLASLRPKEFFTYLEYGMRYCNGKKTAWGWDFTGSSNMGELQLLLEELVMIRRLKSDVIKQLPDKFRQMIILDPSQISTKNKVLKAMSQKMREASLKGMERRGVLLEYFHETGEVKLKAVCEYVTDLLEGDKKFICFAHHQNVINGLCQAVEGKGVDYIRIDGAVSSDQRKKLCDKFQKSDECRVAVLSITSANCGITLTAASLVVFAELFWNPGILTQAEDRAHRIGQEDSVVVQYLVAKGTADDEIWPLVQRKLDTLNKAGLSKDNFKSADTIVRENTAQTHLEDFWSELDESLEMEKDNCDIPEKRLKLE